MTVVITKESAQRERIGHVGSLARRIQLLSWLGEKACVNELTLTRNNADLCEGMWALSETVGEIAARIADLVDDIEYPNRRKEADRGAAA